MGWGLGAGGAGFGGRLRDLEGASKPGGAPVAPARPPVAPVRPLPAVPPPRPLPTRPAAALPRPLCVATARTARRVALEAFVTPWRAARSVQRGWGEAGWGGCVRSGAGEGWGEGAGVGCGVRLGQRREAAAGRAGGQVLAARPRLPLAQPAAARKMRHASRLRQRRPPIARPGRPSPRPTQAKAVIGLRLQRHVLAQNGLDLGLHLAPRPEAVGRVPRYHGDDRGGRQHAHKAARPKAAARAGRLHAPLACGVGAADAAVRRGRVHRLARRARANVRHAVGAGVPVGARPLALGAALSALVDVVALFAVLGQAQAGAAGAAGLAIVGCAAFFAAPVACAALVGGEAAAAGRGATVPFEPRVALAPIAAVRVDALLVAVRRAFRALVNVGTRQAVPAEAPGALALAAAESVDARAVRAVGPAPVVLGLALVRLRERAGGVGVGYERVCGV